MAALRAPAGLGAAGRNLWRSVAGAFDLDPDEAELLRQACRCADELADLRSALAASDTVVAGSTGQPRPNPLYTELRAHRETLARLLRALDLPDEEAARGSAASARASEAARRRWRAEKHRRTHGTQAGA
jgi:hypothetical protein